MSLLLDALKRAEQEKLARQAERAAQANAEAPEERSRPVARAGRLELESLEAPEPAPSAASPVTVAGERANAQAMFAAKAVRPGETAASRVPLYAAGALVAVLVIAGGAYVWYQVNAQGSGPYPARPAPQAALQPITPAAPAGAPLPMPPAAPVPPPASGIVPTNPAAPPVARLRPEALSPAGRRAPPPAADAEKLVQDLLRESAAPTSAAPLRLARSMVAPRIQPEIAAGYDSLRQGDLAQARRSYQAALAADANGIDGLLGLATVEARAGDRAAAGRLYRKVLTLDGRNATALAGLAALADFSRPEALEPALRADIARYPQSAALQMTLGNLHASQSRWAEAQSAFFEAHRLEPQNADVLYNLAVALDNLNQPRVALDYYRRALAQAKGQAVQFDARGAERRLAELQR